MPEYWEPGGEVQKKTIVPLARAMKIIRSLTVGGSITTKNGVSFFRQPEQFRVMVSASRSKGGDVYLDPDILSIVEHNNFEKVSDKMTATLKENKIDQIVEILQEKFNDSVSLNLVQYELIQGEISKRASRERQMIVIQPKQNKGFITEQLELEAMALELELKLLNFAA